MRRMPRSQLPSPTLVVTVLFALLIVFQSSRPWLKPWLHAHFSNFTASAIGNGITFLLYAGMIGYLGWFYGDDHAQGT
jgi:hypothetical protein